MCNYLKLVWQQSEILSEAATIVFLLFKMNQIVILAFLSMVLCSIARANVVGPVNEKGNQKNLVFFICHTQYQGAQLKSHCGPKNICPYPRDQWFYTSEESNGAFIKTRSKHKILDLAGQIISFRGPYVVHTCTIASLPFYWSITIIKYLIITKVIETNLTKLLYLNSL